MAASLCIHGHFYQPPREDPWLGETLAEASAAPMRNWNERITRESYAPLAWARRLDADGGIFELLNCYEWISFNAGPTLLRWLRRAFPDVLARMVQGDARSLERWGHGNAMAQAYHHTILPLTDPEDRKLEVRWAIDDFRHHFGRAPEGMWLPECAADVPSLECLAEQDIRFVVLAPRQARAVVENGLATEVSEETLAIGEPYRIALPSGRAITAVFYHGGLSQGIAFEGLLRNGETFWQRITAEAAALSNLAGNASGQSGPSAPSRPAPCGHSPLLTLATDGETYGHHFTFGEMALAYVLSQAASGRDRIRLTNLPAYIAANPPTREVLIHEPSSWSCVHGVERWRSDCGCSDGGHQGWNQQWRAPLRGAIELTRNATSEHFLSIGNNFFTDPSAALLAYGEVLADPSRAEAFAQTWFTGTGSGHDTAWNLLAMREQSLAAQASCAWFFDDIARVEPENAMTFALRAIDYLRQTGGPDLLPAFSARLEQARSNQNGCGSGKDVFEKDVLPRRSDPATLCLSAWLRLDADGRRPEAGQPARHDWPEVSVELVAETGCREARQTGRAVIRERHEQTGKRFAWEILAPSGRMEKDLPFLPLAGGRIILRPQDTADATTENHALANRAANPAADAAINQAAHQQSTQEPAHDTDAPPLEREAADFSRPLADALLADCLESWEKDLRPRLLAMAAHAASMTRPWQEAQHDVIGPEFWITLTPYLTVEVMTNDALTQKQRRQLEVLISTHLGGKSKALACSLVRDTILETLTAGEPSALDLTLALWVRRVRFIMPDMDWWAVQNRVWDIGPGHFPALARELGFATNQPSVV